MDPLYLDALATLETAGGRKTIKGPNGEDSFNLYNIKDFSGKGFRAFDKAEGSNDAYRVYASADAAKQDLIGLLSRKYPKALEATSPLEFATALKTGGYATDPKYVEKFVSVAQRLAGSGDRVRALQDAPAPSPVPSPSPAPDRSLAGLYAAAEGPRPPKQFAMTKTAAAAGAVAAMPTKRDPLPEEDFFSRASDQAVAAKKRVDEEAGQGVLDIAKASVASTFLGAAFRRWDRPDFEPDGSLVTEEELVGYSIEEQDAIREGNSKAARDRIRFDIDDVREQQREAGKSGVGYALLGGLIAGAPEAIAAGGVFTQALRAAKLGSLALASQGRTGAALGSMVVENVGSGLALTAATDYLTPDIHLQDYVIGAVADGVTSAVFAPSVLRAGRMMTEDRALHDVLTKAVQDKQAEIETARATLGPDATSEEVGKAVSEAQAARVRSALEAQRASLGSDRKLIPDDVNDELFGDVPLEQGSADKTPAGLGSVEAAAPAKLSAEQEQAIRDGSRVNWDSPDYLQRRVIEQGRNPVWIDNVKRITNGLDYDAVTSLPAGVHVSKQAADNVVLRPAIQAIKELAAEYLPKVRVYVGDGLSEAGSKAGAHGEIISVGRTHMIGVVPRNGNPTGVMHTAVHELGHAVFHEHARHIPADLMAKIKADHAEFTAAIRGMDPAARQRRFSITSPSAQRDGVIDMASMSKGNTKYVASIDEYMAEQYAKHIEKRALSDDPRMTKALRQRLRDAIMGLIEFFKGARAKGLLRVDEGADEFFTRVLDGTLQQAKKMETEFLAPDLQLPTLEQGAFALPARTDADIIRDYGLDTLAAETGTTTSSAQRARLKAMVHLYRKAEAYPMPDQERMSKLLSSSPMQWAAPTALTLLNSKNPVARMAAAELLESGGGAGGRRSTASIAKWIHEREFMGNSVNDFQRHYTSWRNMNGGGTYEDFMRGEKFDEFNRLVATELENRQNGRGVSLPQQVRDAADVLSAAYDRMRVVQTNLKTPGWQSLPPDSYGYMPHRMAAGRVRSMSPDQGRVLHGVLAEQFERIEGFDADFSAKLASKYIDIMRKRGTAGYSAPVGVHSAEAADLVEESAAAMGMSRTEAQALAKRVIKSQPAHTRHRLKLDLTREYEADGQPFRLLDLFETDQLTLLRAQAGRVSGEAALVKHGIMGSTGMKLLRESMDYGTADGKATNAELEAFDQVAAELLGQPFGKVTGKWIDRALQFNSVASLGGIGFNQLAETLNGAVTLGVGHALSAVGSARRLRSEIIALAKGQRVNNPIIGSIETYGAEFGTDNYKLIFPFDNPHHGHEVYGTETLTATDRLLRSGSHLQSKLSLWRAITATQERGFAEQIVHKALRYIRDGQDSVALQDMGISSDLMVRIRAELPNTARFDARGKLEEFDITKMEDQSAANEFVQAVHRGTRQIIQGAFIGETGKWAHSSLLKLMVQFRTFSLIAIDKQWARQAGNHGTAKALGILLGTMTFALPIVMVRKALASLGRPDQEEYLERELHPVKLARETLNYVALSGLSGDLLDALSAVSGFEPTGGRSGSNKSLVGNVVAPAVGKLNDVWGAVQDTREGTNLHGLVKELPLSRLPWLYPAVNALKAE